MPLLQEKCHVSLGPLERAGKLPLACTAPFPVILAMTSWLHFLHQPEHINQTCSFLFHGLLASGSTWLLPTGRTGAWLFGGQGSSLAPVWVLPDCETVGEQGLLSVREALAGPERGLSSAENPATPARCSQATKGSCAPSLEAGDSCESNDPDKVHDLADKATHHPLFLVLAVCTVRNAGWSQPANYRREALQSLSVKQEMQTPI